MKINNTVIFVGRNVRAFSLIEVFNSIKRGNLGEVTIKRMDELNSTMLTKEEPIHVSDTNDLSHAKENH